jgi:nitrite reductase (NADH) small subunit
MPLHPVAKVSEIPPGGRKLVKVGKIEIGVFNVGGAFFAYRNVCPHAGAPVCLGRVGGTSLPSAVYEYQFGLEGCILRCPWHGWEFDLRSGEHLVDPGTRLKRYDVQVETETLEKIPVEVSGDSLSIRMPG